MTVEAPAKRGIGESLRRPDGVPTVKGDFAHPSYLWAEGMPRSAGPARETGPGVEALIGSRDAVLGTLDAVVRAALGPGAHRLDVRLEAPAESR